MDSLTQIVLGAAVGEACLGKKLGNRAMVWGAIGGTIPDLDVMSNLFMNELDATMFHRSITHSIAFSFIFPLVMAWLAKWIYNKGWYENRKTRFVFYGISLLMMGSVLLGINTIVHNFSGHISLILLVISLIALGWFAWRWHRRYIKGGRDIELPSYRQWYVMFFWAFFTHILLDSMTAYGTQLFYPFSDWRIAINNIAVVDPLYTIPFMILVIFAGSFYRRDSWRKIINISAIGLSSIYLIFTLYNHARVKHIFKESLRDQKIEYTHLNVTPTIFNNALWSGVARNGDQYYFGRYSIFDQKDEVLHFRRIDGNHELLKEKEDYPSYEKLRWFSNGYFGLIERDGFIQYNDLRYGLFGDERAKEENYIFYFELIEKEGDFVAQSHRGSEDETGSMKEAFAELWTRIKGI
jgi:inner membrane protein